MGFSSHLDLIRSLLLRLHALSKRRRRLSSRHSVGCVGRLRSLSIPTLSSLRSWREEPPERRRGRRRKKEDRQSFGIDEVFVSPEAIPSEEEEFASFTAMHPGYLETLVVDELRDEEYSELQEDGHVCLDYSGHGLFSQLQQELDSSSSSFAISHISGDLSTQAFYVEPNEGTVESDIRRRVMRFLNIQEGEYGMVFTASKGSAFKLLAESYPFDAQRSLLTMFDYQSEAVSSMEEIAQRHGAHTLNASFHFPSLTVCSADLKSQILYKSLEDKDKKIMDSDVVENRGDKKGKKKMKKVEEFGKMERTQEENRGMFVFPVQSRVSGTKYSYQWMSLAQDNGWHVLLDASALGPKDMDSLGLSLFRPDFIVTSFYKVFGSDPTGFGCLFVKNSSMSILCPSTAARNIGMVRLIPLTEVSSPNNPLREEYDNTFCEKKAKTFPYKKSSKAELGQAEIAFSGPASTFFKWRQSISAYNAIKVGDCLEEVTREKGDSVLLKKNVMQGNGNNYVEHVGRALKKKAVDLDKGKTPITPRSVLEESLLEGPDHSNDGESHELDGCSSSGLVTQEKKLCSPSEDVFKGSDVESLHSPLGPMQVISLPTHSSQNALDRRRFLASRSHEIARQGIVSTGQGTFSQPLISHDAQGNPFFVHSEGSSYYAGSQDELEFSSSLYDEDEESSEFDYADDESIVRREPEIYCRGLNHADTLGLNKTNDRLRFLTNWLVSSMLKLQHLVSNKFMPLVHLYGPKVKYDRGASLAFNLFDCKGALIKPCFVQQLADRNNISLGLGVLSHIRFLETCAELQGISDCGDTMDELSTPTPSSKNESSLEFQVVTAALGFFTNFEDVYKLWAFVAKFLDAEFVKHELCTIH